MWWGQEQIGCFYESCLAQMSKTESKREGSDTLNHIISLQPQHFIYIIYLIIHLFKCIHLSKYQNMTSVCVSSGMTAH